MQQPGALHHYRCLVIDCRLDFLGFLFFLFPRLRSLRMLSREMRDASATRSCKSPHSKWVVYCKRPFAGPRQVLRYLSRYTHRVAISNRSIGSTARPLHALAAVDA